MHYVLPLTIESDLKDVAYLTIERITYFLRLFKPVGTFYLDSRCKNKIWV